MQLLDTTSGAQCQPVVSTAWFCQSHRLGRVALLMFVAGCNSHASKPSATQEQPATIVKLPLETDLATVTLSAAAQRRLGIETLPVAWRLVSPRRTLGGEAIVPQGKTLLVTAPVTGVVSAPASGPIPLPGTQVEQSDPVLNLVPLLSPEREVRTPAEQVQLVGARANLAAAQIVARGDVQRSGAEVEAAKITLQRAKQLFEDRAGARKAVDDAIAQLNIAETTEQAATQREEQLTELLALLEAKSPQGKVSPLPLRAPISGVLNRLGASAGQTVGSGAMLFEVVNLDTIWIRVPVFVDLLSSIKKDQIANLVSLSGKPLGNVAAAQSVEARPIAAPPTADALTSSADLYYEIDNRSLGIRPGQRVGVELPLAGDSEALVVPYASIVLDIHGNAWVYAVSGERRYTRQRVSIRWTESGDAILESGPKLGTEVVVAGAAELFGTEFGTGK